MELNLTKKLEEAILYYEQTQENLRLATKKNKEAREEIARLQNEVKTKVFTSKQMEAISVINNLDISSFKICVWLRDGYKETISNPIPYFIKEIEGVKSESAINKILRNIRIFTDYENGIKTKDVALKYGLTIQTIKKVYREVFWHIKFHIQKERQIKAGVTNECKWNWKNRIKHQKLVFWGGVTMSKSTFIEVLQYALDKDMVVVAKKKGRYIVSEKKEK